MAAALPSWKMAWMTLQLQLMSSREASDLTQDELASTLGVSRSTFQRWEHGRAVPDAFRLFRWADLLGISITSAPRPASAKAELTTAPSTQRAEGPVIS